MEYVEKIDKLTKIEIYLSQRKYNKHIEIW